MAPGQSGMCKQLSGDYAPTRHRCQHSTPVAGLFYNAYAVKYVRSKSSQGSPLRGRAVVHAPEARNARGPQITSDCWAAFCIVMKEKNGPSGRLRQEQGQFQRETVWRQRWQKPVQRSSTAPALLKGFVPASASEGGITGGPCAVARG